MISEEILEIIERIKINITNHIQLPYQKISHEEIAAIAKALEKNTALQTIYCIRNDIDDEGVSILIRSLEKNTGLSYINLSENRIGNDGAYAVARFLEHNNTMRPNFNLSDNNITNRCVNDLVYLTCNKKITLTNNGLTINHTRYFSGRLENIKKIDFTNFNLSINDIRSLYDILATHPEIGEIYLSGNNIDADSARALAKALENSVHLKSIRLSNNGIGDIGASAIAAALEKNSNLGSIDLSNNSIGDNGVITLSSALEKNSNLGSIDLSNNSIGDNGVITLSSALEKNSNLRYICLSNNSIGDNGVIALAGALKNHRRLDLIYLGENAFGDSGASALAVIFEACFELRALDIQNNRIGDAGALALANELKKHHLYQNFDLDLRHNNIGNQGAIALASALKNNTELTRINLSNNCIGNSGAIAFGSLLKITETLTALDFSDNKIGIRGVKALAKGLVKNKSLTRFTIGLHFPGQDSNELYAKAFANVLEKNTIISYLYFHHNNASELLQERIKLLTIKNKLVRAIREACREISIAAGFPPYYDLDNLEVAASPQVEQSHISTSSSSTSSLMTRPFSWISSIIGFPSHNRPVQAELNTTSHTPPPLVHSTMMTRHFSSLPLSFIAAELAMTYISKRNTDKYLDKNELDYLATTYFHRKFDKDLLRELTLKTITHSYERIRKACVAEKINKTTSFSSSATLFSRHHPDSRQSTNRRIRNGPRV